MPVSSNGITDPGCVRAANEDRILSDDPSGVYAVCDGIGGRRRGEMAAEVAVNAIRQYIESSSDPTEVTWPYGYNPQMSFAANRLVTAIKLANRQVWRRSEESLEFLGMGTTISAVLIDGGKAVIANIGDSRVYRWQDGRLEQLSTDDIAVMNLPSGDATHRTVVRSILTRTAGSRENIEIHLREEQLVYGDILLLCSDGLYNSVSSDRIAEIVSRDSPVALRSAELIGAARSAGAPDNVSVIVLEYREG